MGLKSNSKSFKCPRQFGKRRCNGKYDRVKVTDCRFYPPRRYFIYRCRKCGRVQPDIFVEERE